MSKRSPSLGYCCISLGKHRSEFHSTTLTSCKKDKKKAAPKLIKIWRSNLEELIKVLDYNISANIWLFRISSNLFPLADHSAFRAVWNEFTTPENFIHAKAKACAFVRFGGRLTMHPGQFVSLGSPKSSVRMASMENLEHHGEVLDLLGMPENHDSPINIHLSNGVENVKLMDNFRDSLDQLSPAVRNRLVFENEDKAYWTWQRIIENFPDYPVTLDAHHHRINNLGDTLEEAVRETSKTWQTTPVAHLSEGAEHDMDRTHHGWVQEIPYEFMVSETNLAFDVELEAKQKDLAVLYLKSKYRI